MLFKQANAVVSGTLSVDDAVVYIYMCNMLVYVLNLFVWIALVGACVP